MARRSRKAKDDVAAINEALPREAGLRFDPREAKLDTLTSMLLGMQLVRDLLDEIELAFRERAAKLAAEIKAGPA